MKNIIECPAFWIFYNQQYGRVRGPDQWNVVSLGDGSKWPECCLRLTAGRQLGPRDIRGLRWNNETIFGPGTRVAIWIHVKKMSLSSKPHFKNLEQRGRSIEQTNPRGARAIATRSAHGNLIATDMNVHSGPSWMDPFIKYLDRGELPSTKMKKKKKKT